VLFAGGMAGVFNWLTCIPQDTVKSRYQTGEPHPPKHHAVIITAHCRVIVYPYSAKFWRGKTLVN